MLDSSDFLYRKDHYLTNLVQRVASIYEDDKLKLKATLAHYDLPSDIFDDVLEPPGILPYGRKCLYRDSRMEVMVMNWGAKRDCLPHDHGGSEGWVKVVRGAATHGFYTRGAAPRLSGEQQVHEGQVIYAPPGMVHHMGNPGDDPLVTLHIYFPPISGMEVFDLEGASVARVSSDCGAWWPQNEAQLLEVRELG